jgi:uncharacterized protein YbaR (Trm112 family)/SAM-dependent methyltransferase
MNSEIKISESIHQMLRCPICKNNLELINQNQQFHCTDERCNYYFPILQGVPCLINEKSSIFLIDDFIQSKSLFFNLQKNKIKDRLQRIGPTISTNTKARENYKRFAQQLLERSPNPMVLVLGGSILGQGMKTMLSFPAIKFIESDVSFGPRTMLICDAHDIPFRNETFDGVIAQAVLEHVVDPYHCVEEIHRVLKKDGLIYAETPFIQQVHGRQYDFTRFTHLGHRRLFRQFEQIESGAVCGPGMALAWSYQYFLLSFTKSKVIRSAIKVFGRFTSFFLKYFDYYLINKSGTLDAASGYFFMGRKSEKILSDKELIKLYEGAF